MGSGWSNQTAFISSDAKTNPDFFGPKRRGRYGSKDPTKPKLCCRGKSNRFFLMGLQFRTLGTKAQFLVTAQVGDLVQDRRRDFAKDVGSPVRASMMAQPCFLAVEKNERMSAKSTAPSTERKPPEIFWRNFIMRPSRSA